MEAKRVELIFTFSPDLNNIDNVRGAMLTLDGNIHPLQPKILSIQTRDIQPEQDSLDKAVPSMVVEVLEEDQRAVIEMLSKLKAILYNPVLTALGTPPRA